MRNKEEENMDCKNIKEGVQVQGVTNNDDGYLHDVTNPKNISCTRRTEENG